MNNRYRADKKSGPVVVRLTQVQAGRNVVFGPDKCERAKRPVTKKTASELLVADDNKRKNGVRPENLLTAVQRETLVARAGDNYSDRLEENKKPVDPFQKRKGETTEEYISRINRLLTEQNQ